MQNFKNKLYDFEAAPPEKIWSDIRKELSDNNYLLNCLWKPGLPDVHRATILTTACYTRSYG